MKKVILFLLVFSLFLPVYSFALLGSYTVGSGTWSPSNPQAGLHYYGNNRYKLTLEATSNGSGNASITISDLGMLDIAGHSCIVVDPDGTDTPSADFDLSITDSTGREILTGGDVDVANKLKQLGQEERDQLFNDLVKVCRYVVQKLKYQKEHLDL